MQVLALEQLHGIIPEPVVGDAVVEHPHRVRVRQLGQGSSFALEAKQRRRAAQLPAHGLQSDAVFEHDVVGGPDVSHRTDGT
jgi:hypothetical protein